MRLIFALTIFLSAFLLFQVQPLMGKLILPWYGSSAGVWVNVVLFFQAGLLIGYAYAHLMATWLAPARQVVVHVTLLIAAILFLPFLPSPEWAPCADDSPSLGIFMVLLTTVGLPYVALSSTSPLLQNWYAKRNSEASPYRLYAVSNAGSLLALLSYPFVFEVYFTLRHQSWIWASTFGLFALLTALITWRYVFGMEVGPETMNAEDRLDDARPGFKDYLLWLLLSASGSVLLLATMNVINQDLPAVPFLFILPLAIYLLTFIAAFDHSRWYVRRLFIGLMPAVIAVAMLGKHFSAQLSFSLNLQVLSAALLVCLMCCHGELAKSKPVSRYLTHFYLMVATGGMLGGLFVAVIAPVIFVDIREYEIAFVTIYALILYMVGKELLVRSDLAQKRAAEPDRVFEMKPVSLASAQIFITVGTIGFLLLLVGVGVTWFSFKDAVIAEARNFYGVSRVVELNKNDPSLHQYRMNHGTTLHGFQFVRPEKRGWKTAYYGNSSGMGLAINRHPERATPDRVFRMGVIGLGVGTAAAYAGWFRAEDGVAYGHQDVLKFYEINPLSPQYADEYFTFLEDARKREVALDIEMGDARLLMERELESDNFQQFDVLVVDAFSGDAIPLHLLTKEAVAIYRQHLSDQGIIAFHISNRHFDLAPVISGLADSIGWSSAHIGSPENNQGLYDAVWILVTANQAFLADSKVAAAISPVDDRPGILWTDDFANLVSVLK